MQSSQIPASRAAEMSVRWFIHLSSGLPFEGDGKIGTKLACRLLRKRSAL